MILFDSHCHLDVDAFDADRPAVLARARRAGVEHILVPGIAVSGWDRLRSLCREEAGLYPALGLHPVFLDQHSDEDLQRLEQALADEPPQAVGEIGLDFYIKELDRPRQQQLFEAQLVMAREAGLPVVLHIRKAHDQVLATLRRIRVPGGFAHAFNGSLPQAQQFIDLGFRLGFGGTLTYPGSRKIHKLAVSLPLESLVLETDAPDMVVASHRGERNSPEYLPEVLTALAELRPEPIDELARATTANAAAVLGLDI
jgi:TatD DNase family protein